MTRFTIIDNNSGISPFASSSALLCDLAAVVAPATSAANSGKFILLNFSFLLAVPLLRPDCFSFTSYPTCSAGNSLQRICRLRAAFCQEDIFRDTSFFEAFHIKVVLGLQEIHV